MRLIAFLFVFVFCHSSIFADDPSEDSEIILPGQVFRGNYYALGDFVQISGKIEGNAYLTGTQVLIEGEITGDLYVAAGSITISGKVDGDAWILSGGVNMEGEVARNMVVLAANSAFADLGKVNGNLTLLTGNAEFKGWVGGSFTALTSHLEFSGIVDKNMRGFIGKLRILGSSMIKGDLTYKSNEIANIDPQAKIGGNVLYHRSIVHDLMDVPVVRGLVIGSKIAAFLMNFFYTFVMGIIMIRLFPRKLARALISLQEDPLKALGYGLVLLVLFPLSSLILLASVIGAPFALTLIALNIVSFYTVKIFTILWISNNLFSRWHWKRNGLLTLFSGQILYCIVVAVPFIGPFVAFLSMVLGLGAVAAFQKN